MSVQPLYPGALRHRKWQRFLGDLLLLTTGGILAGAALDLFFAPFEIAPSGVSGAAVILNHLIGTPIGLMVFVLNIPIQYLAYRMLGGWRIILKTGYLIVIYSVAIDMLAPYFPAEGITNDRLLSAIFGGILGGIAGGLVYRAGGSFGGTSTLALILQKRLGTSFNTTYLYTDSFTVAAAGLVFGWESALYAIVAIYLDGTASDYVLEGPSTIRTATIITNHPDSVARVIMEQTGHGVTGWAGTGMYTGKTRHVLFVTVRRPEISELRQLIFAVDPDAFIVVGQGHSAYGEGFQPPPATLALDEAAIQAATSKQPAIEHESAAQQRD
ncbi:MAG: YitT family protein [Anaerolineae bacterium]